MLTPRVLVLSLTLFALCASRPVSADAGAAAPPPKSADVMTVNGVQVPAPVSVPDLTDPVGAATRAARATTALRDPRSGGPVATPAATPAVRARRVAPPDGAARAHAPAGSVPALLGPLPRPRWGASAAPAEPKPAEIVTVGEPTGIDSPPGTAADAAKPGAARAKSAAKPVRELSTSHPRDAAAPPPSPTKPEVKR